MMLHLLSSESERAAVLDPGRKFQSGDIVRVVVRGRDYTEGFSNVWVHEMDYYVDDGWLYTVRRVSSNGVYFAEDGGQYGFPPQSLQLVASAAKEA